VDRAAPHQPVGAAGTQRTATAEIYSPDLVAAQQEYLLALESSKRLTQSSLRRLPDGGKRLLMRPASPALLGYFRQQIDQLEQTKQVKKTLTLYSPYGGIVTMKRRCRGSGDGRRGIVANSRSFPGLGQCRVVRAGSAVGQAAACSGRTPLCNRKVLEGRSTTFIRISRRNTHGQGPHRLRQPWSGTQAEMYATCRLPPRASRGFGHPGPTRCCAAARER